LANRDLTPAPRLRDALASPDSKRRYVRRLFSTIADRYDLITALLSYGQDRRWKARIADLSAAGSTTRALDLACGTGDIAFGLARRGARVVGLDITHRMVQLAQAKTGAASVRFVTGDMMALPFRDGQFDLVTTGYGIRNVPEIQKAIAEMHRVLTPGGILLSLDFNRPLNPFVRTVYLTYLTVVGSALGFVLHGDPDTYRYIPESIRRYPGAIEVNTMIRRHGFSSSEHIPVFGGLMAIHHARK
jgi:demethylmenaquinone methyltransferase / 2-methoxy-6-polyprenyl-1,4-benzoquinol methylase